MTTQKNKLKLKKEQAGYYNAEAIIDGLKVRLEVTPAESYGFCFEYTVNDYVMWSDGWTGLTLKGIKEDMNRNTITVIQEYKDNYLK